ncbi:MAG TPA: hypothetical protein VFH66_06035 [Mycobacteriales bacterium]|nr:hypothetical protein [Mycobacteriales bacterium]
MKTSTRLIVGGIAAGTLAATLTAVASTSPIKSGPRATFGNPTVVDFFRPGYEPDLAIAKAGPYKGSTFTSVPNGFSTTMSYLWRSDDGRQSFHMTEGNALGKQATCVGGGDTELQIDPVNGDVYFNDLQGLTNFTNSRSTDGGHTWDTSCTSVNGAGVDRQWIGIDSNGGKSAVGPGAGDGRLYFDYDNIERNGKGGAGGNQLVMNTSVDGVHYGNKCEAAEVPCLLPPAVITHNEVIPGNIVVDNVPGSRFQHRVYAIHTGDNGASVVVSYCSGKKGDKTAAQVAEDCTDPTAIKAGGTDPLNIYWHDSFARKPGQYQTGQLFPSIAIDTAGNLYAAWSEYPAAGSRTTGPGTIKYAVSTDGAQHWSAPITVSPKSLGNDVMPWIVAGSKGRVGIAWYGSTTAKDSKGEYGPDPVDTALWNLYYTVSTNALAKRPAFGMTKVSDHPVKYGDISTGGLGGSQDRSLGDFFQVQMGLNGEAVISYVDDTSADRNQDTCGGCGETPAEAAGPVMVVSQNGGPSLLAGKTVPHVPTHFGAVQNKPGRAFLGVAGQDVKAPKALDVIASSVRQVDAKHLRITLTTADKQLASDLTVAPPLGGPVNTWTVRWAAPSYGKPGDGNQFYVAMQSVSGGAPTFYTGTTQAITTTHTKYFTYPATTAIKGTIQGATISWTVPLSLIGNPHKGDGLFSITGFTSTQAAPASPQTFTVPDQGGELGDANIPNLIGATSAYTFIVR